MAISKKSLFCFGTGYSAQVIARAVLADGWRVIGTYRDAEDAKTLSTLGVKPILFEDAESALEHADAILSSVPPNETGDPVLVRYGDLLSEISQNTWIGYLSTTGVYGDTGGALVDETSELNPSSDRSHRRAAAEKEWLKLPVHIFRLAGIYGPGRSSLDRLKRGLSRSIDFPGRCFSRIHVEDIAQTVISSIDQPSPGSIYNLCDDEAIEQNQVEAYAASLLGIEAPPLVPFEEAFQDMSAMAKTFWQDNRRVDNSKIKQELGINLIYPTFREGLKALDQSS
jgi:nucleoside-diphosphate-sugar epimerase